MSAGPDMLPYLVVGNASAWSQWLITHATTSPGVWLHLARKGHSRPTTLTWEEAVDEALCHGWIDGQAGRAPTPASVDATMTAPADQHPIGSTRVVRFTPRRKGKSIWSQKNVGNIIRLQSEGRMYPMGEAAVALAKDNGTWEAAYAGSSSTTAVPPPEFFEALEKANPRAKAMYDILTSQNRYAVYFRLQSLKTDQAKERNIRKFVEMLERGETLHPQKRKLGDTSNFANTGSASKKGGKVSSKSQSTVSLEDETSSPRRGKAVPIPEADPVLEAENEDTRRRTKRAREAKGVS